MIKGRSHYLKIMLLFLGCVVINSWSHYIIKEINAKTTIFGLRTNCFCIHRITWAHLKGTHCILPLRASSHTFQCALSKDTKSSALCQVSLLLVLITETKMTHVTVCVVHFLLLSLKSAAKPLNSAAFLSLSLTFFASLAEDTHITICQQFPYVDCQKKKKNNNAVCLTANSWSRARLLRCRRDCDWYFVARGVEHNNTEEWFNRETSSAAWIFYFIQRTWLL